jgi:hypothetical protein
MIITYSKNAVPIRVTQERWTHIARRHPEMRNQKEKVVETVSNPDWVLSGDFGELLAVRFYPKTPLTEKYLVVAYNEISAQDGFVITAYFTSTLWRGRKVVWKR